MDLIKVATKLLEHLKSRNVDSVSGSSLIQFLLDQKISEDEDAALELGEMLHTSGFIRLSNGNVNQSVDEFEKGNFSMNFCELLGTSSTVHPQLQLPPFVRKYQTFDIYKSNTEFYIVGFDHTGASCKLLEVDRMSAELSIKEESKTYTPEEIDKILMEANPDPPNKEGPKSKALPGLRKVGKAFGIIGFVRFLYGYHMILITQRRRTGSFGGHVVYSVQDTEIIPITNPSIFDRAPGAIHKQAKSIEQRYTRLFSEIPFKQDFYFSYTYDLTRTLQYNMINSEKPTGSETRDESTGIPKARCPRSMYIWNSFLQEPFRACVRDSGWHLHLIHGYFEQIHCSVFGRWMSLTLIARRSRLFAGTRYLKRGLSNRGKVANDVEVEQIVNGFDRHSKHAGEGRFSSYVQNRASIPLFWTQHGHRMVAKPEIIIQKTDPLGLTTAMHFKDLFRRYGSPVLAVNLIRQHEKTDRERVIGIPFTSTVELLNKFLPKEHKIDYLAWDFKHTSKSLQANVMDELAIIAEWAIQRNGVFCSHPLKGAVERKPGDTAGISPISIDEKLHLKLATDNSSSNLQGPTRLLYPGCNTSRQKPEVRRHLSSPRQLKPQKSLKGLLGWLGSALNPISPQRPRPLPRMNRRRSEIRPPGEPSETSAPANTPRNHRLKTDVPPGVAKFPMEFAWLWSFDAVTVAEDFDLSEEIKGIEEQKTYLKGLAEELSANVVEARIRMKKRTYRHVFIGMKAVDFLCKAGHAGTREDAVDIGNRLMRAGHIEHIDNEINFKDGTLLYRIIVGNSDKKYSLAPKKTLREEILRQSRSSSRKTSGLGLFSGLSKSVETSNTGAKANETKLEPNVCVRQRGVLRVNCIDSLDRTNVAQFCVGKCALGYQLHGLGMSLKPSLERDSRLIPILLDMYERMGDRIAMQYGGSEMHRAMDTTATPFAPTDLVKNRNRTKAKKAVVSFLRHYQNTFKDNIKQNAYNLLLGIPYMNSAALKCSM